MRRIRSLIPILALSLCLAPACSSDDETDVPDAGPAPEDGEPGDGSEDGAPADGSEDGAPDDGEPGDGSDGTQNDGNDGDGEPDAGTDEPSALDDVCTPSFTLELLDDDPTRVGLFMDAMDGDPEATAQAIGRAVCKVLYRAPEEVRDATHLTLRIEYAVGDVAWKAGDGGDITVMISSDHIQNVANDGVDVAKEVKGVLYHEMTHMYQHDDSDAGGVDIGLIEGIADFVRISSGFPPPGAQPNPRGNWNDGYRTTAFFLMWVDETYPDFVYELNLSMTNKDNMAWSPASFSDITGFSAEELWQMYVDTF